MKKLKDKNAITLIALVVTIIVLLVLAGVTISMLTGDNGILQQTTTAKNKSNIEQEIEEIRLALNSALIRDLKSNNVNAKTLNQELKNTSLSATATKAGKSAKVTLENGHIYIIDEKNNISEYKESEITPVYVIIYDDGEMVFSTTGQKDELRTILYDGSNNNIGNTTFESANDLPWVDYVLSIERVTFLDKIVPANTAIWFARCNNLHEITNIDLLDTSHVTSMQGMFAQCFNIETLDLSYFDTENVTNMQQLFFKCENLKTLDITGFETKNVTTMRSMFSGCLELEKLDLSSFDTSNVISMQKMFLAAEDTDMKLKEIKGIESFDTRNLEDIYCMFQYCKHLETLNLSSFDTSKVTDARSAFLNCENLKTIYASDKFIISSTTPSDGMFHKCNKLVGGNGTSYNSSKITGTMAWIDGVDSKEGYFTQKK